MKQNKKNKSNKINISNYKIIISSFIVAFIMALIVIVVRYPKSVDIAKRNIEHVLRFDKYHAEITETDYNNGAGTLDTAVAPSFTTYSQGGLNLKVPDGPIGKVIELNQAVHSYKIAYQGFPHARLYCMNAERLSGVVTKSKGYNPTENTSISFEGMSLPDLRALLDSMGISYSQSDSLTVLKNKIKTYYTKLEFSNNIDTENEAWISGTIYERLSIIYALNPDEVRKPLNPKDDYEVEFVSEDAKKNTNAKVDGLVGYAKWQLELENELLPSQFQEILWMSGYIEKWYGSGEDKQAYASMSDSSYRGLATTYGNGDSNNDGKPDGEVGVVTDGTSSENCVRNHFLKDTNLYDIDKASRAFQYDICYDTIFNNLKTYYKCDINLNGVKYDDNDLVELRKIIDKANKPNRFISPKEFYLADINDDGKLTDADITAYTTYRTGNKSIVNDKLKCGDLLKAEVDNKTSQTMVDQDDRSFLVGPYNVNLKINKDMLQKTTGNQDPEKKQIRAYCNGSDNTEIYSGIANNIFIKELLKTNKGQTSANTFAELDGNAINITVVDADGNIVPIDKDDYNGNLKGPSVYFVNSNGERITNNGEIFNMIANGEYFYLKMKFFDNNVFYTQYKTQYLSYLKGFSIHINFNVKYIDQFYMNRAVYEYNADVSNTYKRLHIEGEWANDYSEYIKMVREYIIEHGWLRQYFSYFEGNKQAAGTYTVERNGTTYKLTISNVTPRGAAEWLQTSVCANTASGLIGGIGSATIYAENVQYAGIIKKVEQTRSASAVSHTRTTGVFEYDFKATDTGMRYSRDGTPLGRTLVGKYYSDVVTTTYYTDPDIGSVDWPSESNSTVTELKYESDLDDMAKSVKPGNNDSLDNGKKEIEDPEGLKGEGVESLSSYTVTQKRTVYYWDDQGLGSVAKDNKLYYLESESSLKFRNSHVVNSVTNKIIGDHVPIWFGSPSEHTSPCYYIHWYQFDFDISIDGFATVGGGTVSSECGKLVVKTYVEGKTVPVTNHIYDGTGYAPWFIDFDSDSGSIDEWVTIKDNYKWQDFMYITDVRYTREIMKVDINIEVNTPSDSTPIPPPVEYISLNAKGPMINIGGKVWIDNEENSKLSGGVFTGVDDYKDSNDVLYEGIEVTLHELMIVGNQLTRSIDGGSLQEIQRFTTVTNNKGEYGFIGLNPFSKYYVTFKYNGQIYQPAYYSTDETNKVRRNKAESGKSTYNSYIENNTNKAVSPGYSIADELVADRNTINSRLVRINSDAEQYGSDSDAGQSNVDNYDYSGNYTSGVTNQTNRAYGLNERIVNSNGDYISAGNPANNDVANTRKKYFKYGLQKSNSSGVAQDGNDNVLTFGDVYARFRELVNQKAESNKVLDDVGFVSVKIYYDENDKVQHVPGEGQTKYDDIKTTLIGELKNLGVSDTEANRIWNYILDTNIDATTTHKTMINVGETVSKSDYKNKMYPKWDYYICEDVTESTLIKASQGNSTIYSNTENPYKLLAVAQKTSAEDSNAVKYHYTLLGTVVNAPDSNRNNRVQEIKCSNFSQGLDYIYTEGTKNGSRLPTAENDTTHGRVTKGFPNTGYWRKHDASCIKNAIDYGIMNREIADLHIDKDVNQIITTVNGQKTTYKYRKKQLNNIKVGINNPAQNQAINGGVASVNRAADGTYTVVERSRDVNYNGTLVYNREIRTADYLYDAAADEGLEINDKNLEVYIQYAIAVENTGDVDVVLNNVLDYYENDNMMYDTSDFYCTNGEYTYYSRRDYTNNTEVKYDTNTTANKLKISDTYRNLYSSNNDGTHNYNYKNVKKLEIEKGDHSPEKVKVGETVYYYITYKVKKEIFKLDKGTNDTDYDRNEIKLLIGDETTGEQLKVIMDQNLNCEIVRAGKRCLAEIGSYSTYYPEGRVRPYYTQRAGDDEMSVTKYRSASTPSTLKDKYFLNTAENACYKVINHEDIQNKAAGLVDMDSNPGNLRNKDLYQSKYDVDTNYPGTALGNDLSNGKDMSYIGTLKIYDDITRTRAEDDTDQAPTINLVYPSNTDRSQLRTIKGNVFEDLRSINNNTTQAVTGDGVKQNNEEFIAGVTVELVQLQTSVNKDTNVVEDIIGEKIVTYKTYKFDEGTKNTSTGLIDVNYNEITENSYPYKAEKISEDTDRYYTSTGESEEEKEKVIRNIFDMSGNDVATTIKPNVLSKGEYAFVNIPAGYYYVRFIYGDNHQTVLTKEITKDEDGNNLNDDEKAKANQVYNLFNDSYIKTNLPTEEINEDGSLREARIENGQLVITQSTQPKNDEVLEGFNTKSYNGQDYKSTIYQGTNIGSYNIKIGNSKTINRYNSETDDSSNPQGYDSNGAAKSDVRIVSNIDGRLFAIDNHYSYNNGTYANSMYALDKKTLTSENKSVAKDVWAYRERANDFAKGYDYFKNDEKEQAGGDETLRNYRAEILSSPSKLLTYRSMNIKKSEYEKEYDLSKLSDEEKLLLAKEQKDAISELEYHTQMVAQTGIIDMSGEIIDRDANNELVFDTLVDNKIVSIDSYELNNVSLGLQERPKAQLKLEHEIVNFKLTALHEVLIDTAETQNNLLSFGKHLEHEVDYKKFSNTNRLLKKAKPYVGYENALEAVTPELDDELLASAKVEITYNLKVTNVGDVDYTDRRFYNTGNENNIKGNIVRTSAYTVVDYPTNGLIFEEENQYKVDGKPIWGSSTAIRAIKSGTGGVTKVGENININSNNYNQSAIKDDNIPNTLVVMIIPDEVDENSYTNETVKEQLKQEYEEFKAQTVVEDAYLHAERHTHPKYSFDLVNRQYSDLLMTYDTILETNSLGNNLIPENFDAKAHNTTFRGNAAQQMSAQDAENNTSKNLVLVSNINAASEKDDYIYNNLAEIVEIKNTNGRRMAFSTPGNEEMASQEAKDDADPNVYTKKDRYQVREIDASIAQKVNFLTPTGGDKSFVIAAATVIVAVALIGITALTIKRYLLKAKL